MTLSKTIWRDRYIWMLVLPGLLYFLIYKYMPMFGIAVAFKDYNLVKGFWESKWVGLKHFRNIFDNPDVGRIFLNTITISLMQILFAFSIPIVLAVMLNEVRRNTVKRTIQTIIYLPHFLSWVVIASISFIFLSSEGIVNELLKMFGFNAVNFLANPELFRPLLVGQLVWKEAGWGTIIYLAALTSISQELYEAADMDGAGRFRKIWHVTLPGIRGTIVILFILQLGGILDTSFEQIYLMLNPLVHHVGDVIDTYVYRRGIQNGDFGFTTAVGLLKSVVGFIMIVLANTLARRLGEQGVY